MSVILLAAAGLTAAEFHLVRDSKPAAQFELKDQLDAKHISHLDLFNSYLKKVSGAELPKENKNLPYTIRIVLEKKPKLGQQHNWKIEFPSGNVMVITATGSSLFQALNEILETGADTRFLGVENCMFQYEPKKNISLPVRNLKSKTGFFLLRSGFLVPNHLVELGFYEENRLQFSHGIPLYAFPPRKYTKGWPSAVMPVLRGKKITRPPANYFGNWQPCYSNPETAREAIKNILEILKKKPQQSITLGINDCFGFCECESCRKMDQGLCPNIFSNDPVNHSNSYYTFVNRVAEAVCREYPDLLIGLLAYTGTIMPPAFPVHQNVVPLMTLDMFQEALDPAVKARHWGVIREWGQKVRMTGVWDYAWGRPYMIPRVNFKNQADFLKYLFANHGCGAFFENSKMTDAIDGPKTYLYSRLLKDIYADPDRILEEWYTRYAGKEAAPYLKEIYQMCEKYWTSEEMKKTPAYRLRSCIYMASAGHMFALKPGFTRKLIDLAVKVRNLARTPGEKARADILLRQMENIDCVASFLGMAYVASKNGEFNSVKDALAFFQFIETDFPRLIAQHRRATAYFVNPDFKKEKKDLYLTRNLYQVDAGVLLSEGLLKSLRYIGSKEVLEGLKRIAALPDMPSNVKAMVKILEQGDKAKNYFSNPKLEKPLETLKIKTSVPYEISSEVLCNGQKTIKLLPAHPKGVPNPDDNMLSDVVSFTITQDLPPGIWAVSLKVFTPAKQAVTDLCLWRCVNGKNKSWEDLRQSRISAGKWQIFSQVATVLPQHTGANIILRPSGFKPNEPLYIGDIRLIRLGDAREKVPNAKSRNLSAEKYFLREKSERGTLFGKTAVINRNPDSYTIAHIPFVWKHNNGLMEMTLNAARPPESKSGKLGVIIYGKKDNTWVPKANVLWNRDLSNRKFVPVKFTVKGKMLGPGEQYLMIFFKMKGTEAAAISDAVMKFK